jgi:hypothetical protein
VEVEGRVAVLDDEAFALVGFAGALALGLGLGFDADADADVEGPAAADAWRLGGLKGRTLRFWVGWRSGGMVIWWYYLS